MNPNEPAMYALWLLVLRKPPPPRQPQGLHSLSLPREAD